MKLSKVDINELHLGQFKSENKRLKTFEKWGFTSVDPKDLAKAGFIYTGREDEVGLFTSESESEKIQFRHLFLVDFGNPYY